LPYLAQLQDTAAEFDGGAHRIGASGLRIDAVERGAGAYHVEMGLFAQKNSRRVRKRSGNAAIQKAQLAKLPDLTGVKRMVGQFGAGQMTHQQREAVAFVAQA
jgi:exoribonuclease II